MKFATSILALLLILDHISTLMMQQTHISSLSIFIMGANLGHTKMHATLN